MWCNWSISEYTHGTIRSFLSNASRTFFHMRVTLSFTCESHFPSPASQTFFQMRVTLSFRCESHFLSNASLTFFHMRVAHSFTCESNLLTDASYTFRCESHFRSDASRTFFQMRVTRSFRCESNFLKVKRRLVWKQGGGWCESEEETGRSPITHRVLFGLWKECKHVARWFVSVTQLK